MFGAGVKIGLFFAFAFVIYSGWLPFHIHSPFTAKPAKATTYQLSGTVYSNNTEENGSATGSGFTIEVKIGSAPAISTSTDSSGKWSYATTTAHMSGLAVIAYIYNQPVKGAVVTLGPTSGAAPNLSIYWNRLNVASTTGETTISNAFVGIGNWTKAQDSTNLFFSTSTGSSLTLDTGYKIVVGKGATYQPAGNVTANSMEVKSSGTYSGGSEALVLRGTGVSTTCTDIPGTVEPLCVSGTFTPVGNTVTFSSTSAATYIAATTYNILNIGTTGDSNNVTYTMAGNATATSTVTVGAGSGSGTHTLNLAGTTLTLSGSGTPLAVGSAGSITSSTSTVTYSNAAITSITNLTYNNLTISGKVTTGTQTFTVGAAFNASGTFTPSGGTVTLSTSSSSISGTPTFSSLTLAASITVSNTASFYINGTLTVPSNSTFTASSGTIYINNAAFAISGTGSLTFAGLTASTTPTSQPSANFTMVGALTVNGSIAFEPTGTVTMKSGSSISASGTLIFTNLTLDSSLTFSTTASFSINGTLTVPSTSMFNATGGTVTINNSAFAIAASPGPLYFAGLMASTTPSTPLTADFSFTGALTVNSTITLAFSGNTVTASSTGWTIVNNNTLSFASTTIAGTPASQPSLSTNSFSFANVLTISTGKLFAPTAGTVTASGTAWTLAGSGTFSPFNFTIAGTPGTQPSASFSFTGALAVSGSVTFQPSSGTITASSTTWAISNSGTLKFYNFTVGGTPGTNPTADFEVTQTMTVNTGKSFTPTAGTLTLSLAGTPLVLSGTGTYSGSGSATVNYTGNGATTIPNAAYYNLNFSPTSGTPTYQFPAGSTPGTWSLATTTSNTIEALAFDSSDGAIYAGDGSNHISRCASNCGTAANWSLATTTANIIYALAFDSSDGAIYAGDYANHISRCASNCGTAANWSVATTTASGVFALAFDSTNNIMYAGDSNDHIYRCTGSCGTASNWSLATTTAGSINVLAFDSSDGAIYAGDSANHISRCASSCGTAANWSIATTTASVIFALAFDSSDGAIYAGDSNDHINRCASNCGTAANWSIATTTPNTIYALAFDSTNNIMYAGDAGDNIYRCTGSCGTAANWSVDYTTAGYVYALAFDSTNKVMYAGDSADHIYLKAPSAASVTVSNNFTVGDGTHAVTADANTNSVAVTVSGNLTVATSSIFSASATTTTVSGNLANNGTFTPNSGTVSLNGTSQALSGGGTNNFYNLTVASGATTLNATATVTVANILTVSSGGTLNAGASTVALTGSGTPFVNSGTFNANTSTVFYNATSGTIMPANVNYYNLNFSPSSGSPTFQLATSTSASSWYTAGGTWNYRKAITINHNQVASSTGETYANFPVLVSLGSDANLAANASSTGADILFTDSSGTTKLNHEIETYASTTGQLVVWVNVGSSGLSTTTDTTLYMYYGNSSASNQQNATSTWDSNYKAVWHLNEANGASSPDSTTNGETLTSTAYPSAATGLIDGAQSFNGTSNFLSNSMSGPSGSVTYSAWIKATSFLSSDNSKIVGANSYPQVWVGYPTHTALFGDNNVVNGSTTLATGSWYYLVGVADSSGNAMHIYVNGLKDDTSNVAYANSAYNPFIIGSSGSGMNGIIDDVRVSSTARSADWIMTEYNNQSTASTFYSVGSQAANSGGSSGTMTYGTLAMDANVTATSTASPLVVIATTTQANELLLAFISSDYDGSAASSTISGGGLSWSRVKINNDRGLVDIWKAYATSALSGATITANVSCVGCGYTGTLFNVVSFAGASSSVGATATTTQSGIYPNVALTTTANNSWVLGVGENWDSPYHVYTATTSPIAQTINIWPDNNDNSTHWTQRTNAAVSASGTLVTIADNESAGGTDIMAAVEVLPSSTTTVTSGAATTTITNNLTINGGTVDANSNNAALTVSGNVAIASGGTFLAPSSSAFSIAGNFTNNGTFTSDNGTITFASSSAVSTISGTSTTFSNFTSTAAGKTIKFQANSGNLPVFTVAGTMTLTGSNGNNINLQSGTATIQWLVNFSGAQSAITYVTITDSGCVGGSANVALDSTATNGGDNGACWVFPGAVIIYHYYGGGAGGSSVPIDNGQGTTTLNTGSGNPSEGGGGGSTGGGSGGGSGSGGGGGEGGGGGASP